MKSRGHIAEALNDFRISNTQNELSAGSQKKQVVFLGSKTEATSQTPVEWSLLYFIYPPFYLPSPSPVSKPFSEEKGNNFTLCMNVNQFGDNITNPFAISSTVKAELSLQFEKSFLVVCDKYKKHLTDKITNILKGSETLARAILNIKSVLNRAHLMDLLRRVLLDINITMLYDLMDLPVQS